MTMTFQYDKRGLLQHGRIGQHWTLTFETYFEMWTFLHRDAILRDNLAGLRGSSGSPRDDQLGYKVHSVNWHKPYTVVLETTKDPMEDMK